MPFTRIDINDQTQGQLELNKLAVGVSGQVLVAGAGGTAAWGEIVIPEVPVTSVDGLTGAVKLDNTYVPYTGASMAVDLGGNTLSASHVAASTLSLASGASAGYILQSQDGSGNAQWVQAAASGITAGQIDAWDTAYSWGDHAVAGYAMDNDVVHSFNGVTGDIIGVNSVDGMTGAVSLAASYLSLSGGTLTGSLDVGTNKITSSYVPMDGSDLVNKAALDNAISGLSWQYPVDGMVLTADLPAPGTTGARYILLDGVNEDKIAIDDGSAYSYLDTQDGWAVLDKSDDSAWTYNGAIPGGAWVQFSGAGQIVAGAGLYVDGNTIGVTTGGISSVELSASVNSDITKGVTAFSWGDHAAVGYAMDNNVVHSFNGVTGDIVGVNSVNGATGAVAFEYVSSLDGQTGAVSLGGTYLTLAGGTMSGSLDLGGNTLSGVGAAIVESVQITTGASAGYFLTSDAAGNATWTEITFPADSVTSVNGATGNVVFGYVSSLNGVTGDLEAVTSFNGVTGAVVGVNSVNGATGVVAFEFVGSYNGRTGAVVGVDSVNGATGDVAFEYASSVNGATGAVTFEFVSSFNGATGPIVGVNSVNGATGAVAFGYVSSFNGLTGDITDGITAGQTANWNAVYEQVGTIVVREALSGAVDGVNVTYVFANEPMANTEEVYLNGLLQEPAGNDYTLTGVTLAFVDAPMVGSRIRASYRY